MFRDPSKGSRRPAPSLPPFSPPVSCCHSDVQSLTRISRLQVQTLPLPPKQLPQLPLPGKKYIQKSPFPEEGTKQEGARSDVAALFWRFLQLFPVQDSTDSGGRGRLFFFRRLPRQVPRPSSFCIIYKGWRVSNEVFLPLQGLLGIIVFKRQAALWEGLCFLREWCAFISLLLASLAKQLKNGVYVHAK